MGSIIRGAVVLASTVIKDLIPMMVDIAYYNTHHHCFTVYEIRFKNPKITIDLTFHRPSKR